MRKCLVCSNELSNLPLLKFENMPASAQDLLEENQLNKEKGIDLNLYQCAKCGLVQFGCDPVNYYRDVIRAGGYSSTMVNLRREEYSKLINKYKLKNKKFIEVGCGQGEFLDVLKEFPVDGYGIEHKSDLVIKAQSKGLKVEENFAENEHTKLKFAPFDVFLSFNFLEHQPEPNGMLQCIYNNLVDGGYGLITVPSLEYILENKSYYEFLRDHIAYYTEDTLAFLFEKNGFKVLEKSRINRDTIEIIVQKKTPVDFSDLLGNFNVLKNSVYNYVKRKVNNNEKVAVWGASHQGFTALSTMGIQNSISYIIDSAPFKQGKFSPASHIKIVSPDYFFVEPVDAVIIIAPGYTDEINNLIREKFGKRVEVACLKTAELEIL